MTEHEFFNMLNNIDDDLLAGAKTTDGLSAEIFGNDKPVKIKPQRRPLWKSFAAAAACLAVVGIAFGAVIAAKSHSGKTVDPNQTVSGSDPISSDLTNDGYPERAKYKYEGDFSELELWSYGIVDRIAYDFEMLAEESSLIVVGTFVDDARQNQPVTGDLNKKSDLTFSGASYNKLRIDAVYKGDAEIGSEIVIMDDYFVNDGKLMYVSGMSSTPMIKGEQWVYFLNKVSSEYGELYYSTGSCDGRFPVPGNENTFVLADERFNSQKNGQDHLNVKKMLDGDLDVLRRISLEYDGLTYNVVGYKDIEGVKFTIGTTSGKYEAGDYIEVLAVVENTTDQPIGLYRPYSGGTHLEVSAVLKQDDCELFNVNVEGLCVDAAISSFIIQPGETCYQVLRFSTYAQCYRPEDTIIADYVRLGTYNGTASIALLSDPYYAGSDYESHSLKFEVEVVNSRTDYEFTMDEFPGVTFKCDGQILTASGSKLYSGMPITDLYLIDLNGDGKRELCSTVCIGSGIVDERIMAYDYANGKLYELAYRGAYDYRIKTYGYYEENKYYARAVKYEYMTNDVIWEKDLDISLMTEVKSQTTQIKQAYKGVTKMIDSADDIGSGVSFEMDEFPGTRVTVTETAIDLTAKDGTVKRLFSNNMPIDRVCLADLNADGRRELVVEYYSMPFVTPGSISYGPEKIFTLIDIENDRGYNMFSNGGNVEASLTVIGDDLYIVKNGEIQSDPLTYEQFLTKVGY